jgi:tetratricopeptide (TPR) repeat protein
VEFGGHALALTLLGTYLRDVFVGDVRRRHDVALLEEDAEQGGHARRVMASYEQWFGQGPELAVLRLLGLFDRPADAALVEALRALPVIPGLTEPLTELGLPQWRRLLVRLRESRLLAQAPPEDLETLDAHPLVREYFGSQLRRHTPEGWRLANDRLYEHLKRTAKELPDTMEEVLPLYLAIGHGCRAGRHQEVLDEVYWKRIRRGHLSYALTVLGAYGEDLGGLAEFFEVPWSRPAAGLSENAQANVLRWAAYRLGALGYVREAMAPFQAALERYTKANADLASVTASVLSQYAVLLGQFDQAQTYARLALKNGERADKVFRRIVGMSYLGRAHFVAGNAREAEECFLTAENWQRERQPQIPLLSSTSNFYYCEWLLSRGHWQEVEARMNHLMDVRRAPDLLQLIPADEPTLTSPMNVALDYLCLGRSYVVQAQRERSACYPNAAVCLNRALDLLYESREHSLIPFALLARAEMRMLLGQLDEAAGDLAQAQEMALFGGMRLYQADGHLETARLHATRHQRDRSAEQREQARRSLTTAKQMYASIGYRCRSSAVMDLEQLL